MKKIKLEYQNYLRFDQSTGTPEKISQSRIGGWKVNRKRKFIRDAHVETLCISATFCA